MKMKKKEITKPKPDHITVNDLLKNLQELAEQGHGEAPVMAINVIYDGGCLGESNACYAAYNVDDVILGKENGIYNCNIAVIRITEE
jgi:hypothetical protein